MDLILKRVITIETRTLRPDPAARPSTYKYLGQGPKFTTYEPSNYERFFIDPLKKSTKKIQIRYYGRIVVKDYLKGIGQLQTAMLKTSQLKGRLIPGFWYWYNRSLKLNNTGKKIASDIRSQLNHAGSTLPSLMNEDKEKAKKLLESLGNNFLLIPGFDKDMFADFKTLFKELDRDYVDSGCTYWSGCDFSGCSFDYHDFGDIGCGTSGCSGCSGCGGCSGCSGCS